VNFCSGDETCRNPPGRANHAITCPRFEGANLTTTLSPRQFALLCNVLPLCASTGGTVTSWIRSAGRNARVGGCLHSKHLTGDAVDVVYDGPPPILDVVRSFFGPHARVLRETAPGTNPPVFSHDHIESAL